VRQRLLDGTVIPAHPLALTSDRTLDERRQTALTRYYVDAGAGGLAVGVHTTQFAIRQHGLLRPVLELARDAAREWRTTGPSMTLVAGVVGDGRQALAEAELARTLGYDAVLLSLAALRDADDAALAGHCRRVAAIMPVFGFYLQPAVGGRVLGYRFWREFVEIPNVVAIKVAPFNRYQTLDVVRAVVESGRGDVALYTGNDDAIVSDLLTPFDIETDGQVVRRFMNGGLLGQWAVWTRRAVEMLDEIREVRRGPTISADWLARGAALTDANGAIFDAAHGFAGCIPGIHEVLRRQGLLTGTWCLDPHEQLSAGQSRELDRTSRAYPSLQDDAFVAEHLDRWLG
jgi:dihydrodipicolinate synthase/N-acetylneuraminate lyase